MRSRRQEPDVALRIDIITLFPEIFFGPLASSITGRAMRENKVEIRAVDLRDFTHDRRKTVDDKPFGGGPGMLMKVEPLFEAVSSLKQDGTKVILTGPAGGRFTQKTAHELSRHYRVSVATSDALEQVITMRDNYETLSANDLLLRIRRAEEAIRENLGRQVVPAEFRNRPFTPENMGVSADGEGKDKR